MAKRALERGSGFFWIDVKSAFNERLLSANNTRMRARKGNNRSD